VLLSEQTDPAFADLLVAFVHVKKYLRSARLRRRAFRSVGCFSRPPRFNTRMPELTRRRYPQRHDCLHIYYGDVQAGTIVMRVGNPHDTDQWEWICGFYRESKPGEIQSGTSATFDEARAEFGSAWKIFLSNRTEADFRAWRDQRDFTARKYALCDAGERLEPPSYGPGKPASRFRKCPCGEPFDMHGPDAVFAHVPHITAAESRISHG
jgi:hypothetical protein